MEAFEEPKAEFNQAIAYQMRMDEILRHLNANWLIGNTNKIYRLLNIFQRELKPMMNTKQKTKTETMKKDIGEEIIKPGKNKIIRYLELWEQELRQIMQDKGLLMPQEKDKRFSLK